MTDDLEQRSGTGSVAKSEETTAQRFSALQTQLLCAAIHFFHRHIRSDADVLQRMEGNQMFRLFFEVPYHNKPDLNRIFPESVHDCSALHVCSFILSILHQGIFSVSAFIVSVIYLSRFKESSRITLHACTWRPLFLTSLLLADKMWEDKPVRNSSLAKLFPVLSNVELNKMESEFLDEIKFNVLVKPDLFCSFCEKLLAEQVHQEISRCVVQSEYAATLQADCVESPEKPGKQEAVEKLADPDQVVKPPEQRKVNGDSGTSPEVVRSGSLHTEVKRHSVPYRAHIHSHQPQEAPRTAVAWTTDPRARCGDAASARSVSVRPLRVVEQAEEQEGVATGPGAVGVPAQCASQPLRRSLPAKSTATQYVPLARAPSVGSTGINPGMPAPGLLQCAEVSSCQGPAHACASSYPVAAPVAMQQSPRSPPPVAAQGSAYRAQTPSGLHSGQVSSMAPVRAGPVVAQIHGVVQPKPRSSSASRVSGVVHSQAGAAAGANVRASSQPMRQSLVMRQVPQGHPAGQAQFSGGHQPCAARQVMVTSANPVRVATPAPGVAPVPGRVVLTRGTIGGYPTAARNPSPAGPTSPHCAVCAVPVGVSTASRGRSPQPVSAGIARPQRSATPTAYSGMGPQVVQRHTMGGVVRRPGLV
mmetsp:Transcript_72921/g.170833  ORF Transcript_72921/g.170833 Transcript_72921/m.170833 type:complete len:644 (+) Transcript_72921:62-1993(+)